LAGGKRVWRDGARPPAEPEWDIVVARAFAIVRSVTVAIGWGFMVGSFLGL